MGSSIVTLKQIVAGKLLATAAVTDLVSGRIFSSHLEDAEAGTTEMPLIVFEALSGFAMGNREVQAVTLELYTYSRVSLDQAGLVYDAAFNALHSERLELTGLEVKALARENQRPVDGFNDVLRAWFVRGRWAVNAVG